MRTGPNFLISRKKRPQFVVVNAFSGAQNVTNKHTHTYTHTHLVILISSSVRWTVVVGMIRTASGAFYTSQTWFLVSGGTCDNAGIRHLVGSVKAGSHGRPFSPPPNAQKLAQRDAADGGFCSNAILLTFKLQQRPKHLLKIPAWKPFNML